MVQVFLLDSTHLRSFAPDPVTARNYRYLAISLITLGLLLGKRADVPLVRTLSGTKLALLIVGLYALTSVLHWYDHTH